MTYAPISAPGQALPGDHNNPPLVDVEALAKRHEAAFRTSTAVLAAEAALPEVIADEADLEKCALHARAGLSASKALEDARKIEKTPFDEAGKQVQNLFKPRLDKLEATKQLALSRMTIWNRKVEEKKRKEAAEAAIKEREEASRRAAAAAAIETSGHQGVADTVMDSAVDSEETARKLDQIATGSSAAELVRTHTSAGTVTSATSAAFEIVDAQALRATLGVLADHFGLPEIEKAVRAYMKAELKASRAPTLAGVRFFNDSKARVR